MKTFIFLILVGLGYSQEFYSINESVMKQKVNHRALQDTLVVSPRYELIPGATGANTRETCHEFFGNGPWIYQETGYGRKECLYGLRVIAREINGDRPEVVSYAYPPPLGDIRPRMCITGLRGITDDSKISIYGVTATSKELIVTTSREMTVEWFNSGVACVRNPETSFKAMQRIANGRYQAIYVKSGANEIQHTMNDGNRDEARTIVKLFKGNHGQYLPYAESPRKNTLDPDD